MKILRSMRRYFVKSNGEKEYIDRKVRYEVNGEYYDIFIDKEELGENAGYEDIMNYLMNYLEG